MRLWAYADDITVAGSPERVKLVVDFLKAEYLQVVTRKCKLFPPNDENPDSFLDGIEVCPHGIESLGVPIGDSVFVLGWL
jgi:hypothetical protein